MGRVNCALREFYQRQAARERLFLWVTYDKCASLGSSTHRRHNNVLHKAVQVH